MRDVRETLDPLSAVYCYILTTLFAQSVFLTLPLSLVANFNLVPLELPHETRVWIDEPAT